MYLSTSSATDGQTLPPTSPRSGTGDTTRSSICFTSPQSTIVTGRNAALRSIVRRSRHSAEKVRDLLERPLRGREPDALHRILHEQLQPLEREREMRAALRPRHRVDLVEDHRARRR